MRFPRAIQGIRFVRQALVAIPSWSRVRKAGIIASVINVAAITMLNASNPNLGHHNPTLLLCGVVVRAIAFFLMVGVLFALAFGSNPSTTKAS